jgi:hypothetical protein
MCLVDAVKLKQKAAKIDITGAYVNADMTGEEVLMQLDPMLTKIVIKILPDLAKFEDHGRMLVRLDKALYGCIQSAKLWNEKLTEVLKGIGYIPNSVDQCVMNRVKDGVRSTVVIFVDDILALSAEEQELQHLIDKLKDEFDEIKSEINQDLSYLGMRIKLNDTYVSVTMDAFIADLLKDYGDTKPRRSPATAQMFELTPGEELDDDEKAKFHTVTAKLLYLAKRVRPDILSPVSFLCTRVRCPTTEDKKKLDRVMGYIYATKDKGITLTCGREIRVIAHIDASFGSHSDGKSHSGMVIKVAGSTILAVSKKQKIVTKSSTEAELVALSDFISTVEQCDEFLREQGNITIKIPIISQDNQSTISLATKGGGASRSKHLRVRQNLVRDKYRAKEVDIRYLPTEQMIADALTKPLQGARFYALTKRIMGPDQNAESRWETGVR